MSKPATEKSIFGPRRRVYLVRHAEVSYFDSAGRPYRPNTVPLNPEGRRQAEAVARALADVALDRVISSDLVRSRESAEILTAGGGGPTGKRGGGVVGRGLGGGWGGEPSRETRFLGGETFGSLEDRVLGCFRGLLGDAGWRSLLIVAHGGVNRTILAHALGHGPRAFGAIEQDAGCVNIVDVDDGGRFVVRLVNYTPYNPAKIGLELLTMERLYRELVERVASANVQSA